MIQRVWSENWLRWCSERKVVKAERFWGPRPSHLFRYAISLTGPLIKSARGQCISLFNFSSPIFNHSHNLNDMRTTSTLSRAIKTTPILITLARQTRWEGPRKSHDTNWLWASTSEISCNSTFWKENRKNLTGIGSLASGSNHYSCLQESRYYPWSYVSSAKLRSILINFWRKYFLYSSEIYGYRC